MRIALIGQWLRAAKQDPEHRSASLTYVVMVVIAQIGWIALMIAETSLLVFFVLGAGLIVVEFLGPLLGERRGGGTPWHSHHIAERYGLLAIIALGEGVVGTVASISAAVGEQGWSTDAVLLTAAGTGLTFGMWWVYFLVPAARLLHAHREVSFRYGYLHLIIFGSIVATGAGLHVAAYYVEHHSKLGSMATVLTVAIPVGAYLVSMFVIYLILVGSPDLFHLVLIVLSLAVLVTAVWLASAGVSMAVCLVVVMVAPIVVVVGYESVGHRRAARAISERVSG
jgi:low temperature requirement protein LtrA